MDWHQHTIWSLNRKHCKQIAVHSDSLLTMYISIKKLIIYFYILLIVSYLCKTHFDIILLIFHLKFDI